MPLKIRYNTKHAPFTVRDLIVRGENVGMTNLLNDDFIKSVNNEWIYYVTQSTQYRYNNLEPFNTNILTAYVYDNFKDRVILGKYADEFDGWYENADFGYFSDMIKRSIEYTLIANKEKYNKMYYAMIAEFNPLWNVDGETITERELKQTGTIDDKKTGTETDRVTGTDEIARRGNDTNAHTGTETNVKDETSDHTKTGTEATAHTGSNTSTTARTTFDSATLYDTERVTDTPNNTDTTTFNTTESDDVDATDTTTFNTSDTTTHNTTDTTTHNTTDTVTHNTNNTNERDLTDNEIIHEIRRGNIGVTTTTKLLTEFVEYSELVRFLDIIGRDVVNSFTYMTY